MTLLASIAAMIAVAASAFLFAGIGALVLRACKVQIDSKLERMLFALGAGVIVFVLLVTLGEVSANTKAGVRIAVAAAAVLGLFGAGQVARVCWAAYRAFLELPRAERSVAYAIARDRVTCPPHHPPPVPARPGIWSWDDYSRRSGQDRR